MLFICSGNRCRSPLAGAFVSQLADRLPIQAFSAGTLDLGSAAPLPEILPVAERFGLDLSKHRSCSLAAVPAPHPDLVLGMERAHAAAAVVQAGLPADRVFTLIEIVRLIDAIPPSSDADLVRGARSIVGRADKARREAFAFVSGEDIRDPFGGPVSGYLEMAIQLKELCARLVQGLFGLHTLPSGKESPAAGR